MRVLYGPDSEVYNNYAVASPVPGVPISGGPVAYRNVRPLGTQLVTSDGRKYRFAASGASTLVIGNLLTAGVLTASQQALAPAAGAVGDRSISLTTGASSAQNLFAEGWASASVTPGIGQCYFIAGHAVMTTGAGDIVYLAPGHALREAITTSTRFDLVNNPYSRVIQSPATTVASIHVGVAVSAPVTLRGCWIGTRGVFCVLTAGTVIAGNVATYSATAGSIAPGANDEQDTNPVVGRVLFAAAASPTMIELDG